MIKVILVDDEPLANEALVAVLSNLSIKTEIAKICHNTKEASAAIIAHRPDLIFLDVMMPEETGIDFLRRLEHFDFEVIFVTAYHEYALDAIKLSALDYVVKPIRVSEVELAVQKALARKEEKRKVDHYNILFKAHEGIRTHIMLPHKNGEYAIVRFSDLLYCKADGHTTQFFLVNNLKLTSGNNLGEYKSLLNNAGYVQTHQSYIVNTDKIVGYNASDQTLQLAGCTQFIPISTTYKDKVIAWLKQKGM